MAEVVISGRWNLMDKSDSNALLSALQQNTAATLAAAIVTARGKPVSIEQLLEIQRHVFFALNPSPGHGTYQAWAHDREKHLAKVYD
jgi:hypothetical protein